MRNSITYAEAENLRSVWMERMRTGLWFWLGDPELPLALENHLKILEKSKYEKLLDDLHMR